MIMLNDYPCIYSGFVPWGYAWSFPGPQYQILGMCSLKQKASLSLKLCFSHFLKSLEISPKDLSCPKGYALPYGNYLSKAGYHNILLIGDAGGFADPILGEGLYYAHKSAQLAAKAIKHSWRNPVETHKTYRLLLNESFITELKYLLMLRRFLFSLPVQPRSKLLQFMFKNIPHKLEEAVQKKRSFKLLLPGIH
jgi:flavin-dependent dehydrogenase